MRPLACLVVIALSAPTGRAADYYLSAAGDDAAPGTSPAAPWATITRLAEQLPGPGDSIHLRGGDAFAGPLVMEDRAAGADVRPITVVSYGTGAARIDVKSGPAVVARNLGHVTIKGLRVTGGGRAGPAASGVHVTCDRPDGVRLGSVTIEDVEASGFPTAGVLVNTDTKPGNSGSGYDGVTIRRVTAFDNAHYGIHVTGDLSEPGDGTARHNHTNVTVSDCAARDNPGDPLYMANHSGSGILVGSTVVGSIENCVAYRNGGLCDAKVGGPVGIWCYASKGFVIRRCASCDNRTGKAPDGGGFDLDGGCEDCAIEYCYSSNNDGAGYLMYDYKGAPFPWKNCAVRFCVSENDGRKGTYGGVVLGGKLDGCDVIHNTVYLAPPESPKRPGKPACLRFLDGHIQRLRVVNNALAGQAKTPPLAGTPPAGAEFAGNLFWGGAAPVAGALVADPQFQAPGADEFVEVIAQTRHLTGYRPRPGSPLLGAGVDLAKYGIGTGKRTFGGAEYPRGVRPDIGAGP